MLCYKVPALPVSGTVLLQCKLRLVVSVHCKSGDLLKFFFKRSILTRQERLEVLSLLSKEPLAYYQIK